jgi:hypothetical protein
MNLSPSTTMKYLAPALELYFNEPLYFPGIMIDNLNIFLQFCNL